MNLQQFVLVMLFALCASCVVNPVPTPEATLAMASDASGDASGNQNGGIDDTVVAGVPTDAADSLTPTVHEVAVKDTEPAADQIKGPHVVMVATEVLATQKLVVVLPANKPADYSLFLQTAARLGHRAIALDFTNESVNITCGAELNCYEPVRLEILDGQDRSSKIKVNFSNSVQNRLAQLLVWLDKKYPSEGWHQFASGSTLHWEKIVIVGHYTSAGQAGIIAKVQNVARVVFLGGPNEAYGMQLAQWVNATHATKAESYRAFVHENDGGLAQIQAVCTALGLNASWMNLDGAAVLKYNNTKLMLTSLPLNAPTLGVVIDGTTPMSAEGKAIYTPIWQLLLKQP